MTPDNHDPTQHEIAVAKRKPSRFLEGELAEVHKNVPRHRVKAASDLYVGSCFDEIDFIDNLELDVLVAARSQLKVAKTHLDAASNTRYEWPANWRVYCGHIAVEFMFKSVASIHGFEVEKHRYIDTFIKMMRSGRVEHRLDAFEAIGAIKSVAPEISRRIRDFLSELETMRIDENRYAKVTANEIDSTFAKIAEIERLVNDIVKRDEGFKRLMTAWPKAGKTLFPNDAHNARQFAFIARLHNLKCPFEWPTELELLLIGLHLHPHRNRTRYGDEGDGSMGPEDYVGVNPPGIVQRLDSIIERLKKLHLRIDRQIQALIETKDL